MNANPTLALSEFQRDSDSNRRPDRPPAGRPAPLFMFDLATSPLPIPVMDIDLDGSRRVADGVRWFNLEQAALRSGQAVYDLRLVWMMFSKDLDYYDREADEVVQEAGNDSDAESGAAERPSCASLELEILPAGPPSRPTPRSIRVTVHASGVITFLDTVGLRDPDGREDPDSESVAIDPADAVRLIAWIDAGHSSTAAGETKGGAA